MLILYTKEYCPFCVRVRDYLSDTEISYEERDVYKDEEFLKELLELGGKKQIPFLVDTEKKIGMYESLDIIEYIRENYEK